MIVGRRAVPSSKRSHSFVSSPSNRSRKPTRISLIVRFLKTLFIPSHFVWGKPPSMRFYIHSKEESREIERKKEETMKPSDGRAEMV